MLYLIPIFNKSRPIIHSYIDIVLYSNLPNNLITLNRIEFLENKESVIFLCQLAAGLQFHQTHSSKHLSTALLCAA